MTVNLRLFRDQQSLTDAMKSKEEQGSVEVMTNWYQLHSI